VWLGEYERHSESRVFTNWRVEDFETDARASFLYGADWGYSIDPSVLIRCYLGVDSVNTAGHVSHARTLFIDREAYRVGVEVDYLPQLFDQVPGAREWTITADSARPETISYLQRHGFPKMIPAVKGKDSVKEGVIFLQNFDIVIHPRCTHAIDEFTMYSFVTDKLTGLVTPVLEDKKNHVIDSVRYAVEQLRTNAFDYKAAGMTSAATW
jgi:phage terminase large subunit